MRLLKALLPIVAIACMSGGLVGCVSIPRVLYDTPQTEPLSTTLKDGTVVRYMRYVPTMRHGRMPVIVLLHGSGEAGGDTYAVLANGPWHYAAEHPDFPFIILAPQEDKDGEWRPDMLQAWLKASVRQMVSDGLPVDRRRIYLTGLSRGGQGTWDFAMRYPHDFAAIAPIAAYSDINQPCRLKGVPVWVFHGGNDGTVPLAKDQALVDAGRACGVDITFTVYNDSGHDAWTRTYDDPALYAWFLKHHRPLFGLGFIPGREPSGSLVRTTASH